MLLAPFTFNNAWLFIENNQRVQGNSPRRAAAHPGDLWLNAKVTSSLEARSLAQVSWLLAWARCEIFVK